MSNKLTDTERTSAKDILDRLDGVHLTAWEMSFIESVTEQTDDNEPWLTTRQWEILHKLDDEKGRGSSR